MKNTNIKIILLSIVFWGLVNNVFSKPEINNWEVFTDLKNVVAITVLDNRYAFFATSGGMYSVNLLNGNIIRKYSNIEGLLSIDLTAIVVDDYKRLWIGASDGSISIYDFYNNSWKYIFDIKNSSESNKSINAFAIYNNFIYVGTSYGIQKISQSSLNFVDAPYYQFNSFPPKTKVNRLVLANDNLYVATAVGVAYVYLINTNLNNPLTWSTYSSPPLGNNVQSIEYFNNKIFAGSSQGFEYFDGNSWNLYPNSQVQLSNIVSIKAIRNSLYFISNGSGSSSGTIYYADSSNFSNINSFLNAGTYNVISSDGQNPIVGTYESGAYININNNYTLVYPNCPFRSVFYDIVADNNGNLWGSAGTDGGFYKYDGQTWYPYNTAVFPNLEGNTFKRIVPGNNVVWATGYGNGVAMITDNGIKFYDTYNSNLPGIPTNSNFCTPVSGAIDQNGRFWLTLYLSGSGANLYSYKGDSIWYKYQNSVTITNGALLMNMAIDNFNTKWVTSVTPAGLYYFNENGSDTIASNFIYGFYTVSDFSSEINNIQDVIVEKNNEVWVATDNGIFIINDPYGAIQHPGNKPAPVKLGIISGNLRVPFTENCQCLYADVLNEKWIGTQANGVFHLSQDGSTLLEQFNIKNSPLLDNNINSVTVNKKTGKAYFGTTKGLIAYQTFAIEPVADFDKIICKPNPYVIPSTVDLRIDGLVENSTVKIITLGGEVVQEFDSPGGRIATWNGLNKKGQLVPSGIYIVVAYNKDATKVGKGKLAIIRK